MKENEFLLIDLDEAINDSIKLDEQGGNYQEEDERPSEITFLVKFFVVDHTAGERFGPYHNRDLALIAAKTRFKFFPNNIITVQKVGGAEDEEVVQAEELQLRFWVLHFEKDRRYGPYYSFGTAQGVMIRKQREYPNDRFDIEEEEFEPNMAMAEAEDVQGDEIMGSQQLISVRVYFQAQGLGSFRAGRFNTANGDSSGWFGAGSAIALRARAAAGHKFSHWTFDGNFGGDRPSRTVRAKKGMRIVGVFVKA